MSKYYAVTYSSSLAHHGIKGQKWGVRLGPPYPLGSDKLALQIHRAAKENEPRITKDVKTAARLAGAKMYGLENRLKTEESLKRKIETDAKEKGITESQAAKQIKDSVRYTTISKDDEFVRNYDIVKGALESQGYKEVRCKNYWDLYRQGKVKHKSVQSVFKSPDNYIFEIQFQTPSSQRAKDKKLPLYEERRKLGVDSDRAAELENKMDALAQQVSTPKDIYKIRSH